MYMYTYNRAGQLCGSMLSSFFFRTVMCLTRLTLNQFDFNPTRDYITSGVTPCHNLVYKYHPVKPQPINIHIHTFGSWPTSINSNQNMSNVTLKLYIFIWTENIHAHIHFCPTDGLKPHI